ncbi:MAG: hypothetical protein M1292_11135, partial [Bacteroidetes bacterium]|nr:hypothetical protein [Bacteroidota bacterium]
PLAIGSYFLRFPVSPFLRFSVSPFLRFPVLNVHKRNIAPSPTLPLSESPPQSLRPSPIHPSFP